MAQRVNFPLTIDELIEAALRAKAEFGGDKYILVSDDEEGNGFHECYFGFTDGKVVFEDCEFAAFELKPEQCVTLG